MEILTVWNSVSLLHEFQITVTVSEDVENFCVCCILEYTAQHSPDGDFVLCKFLIDVETYDDNDDDAGGRFKKEVVVDGQSYLLLIRDEGGPPDMQVCQPLINCTT